MKADRKTKYRFWSLDPEDKKAIELMYGEYVSKVVFGEFYHKLRTIQEVNHFQNWGFMKNYKIKSI